MYYNYRNLSFRVFLKDYIRPGIFWSMVITAIVLVVITLVAAISSSDSFDEQAYRDRLLNDFYSSEAYLEHASVRSFSDERKGLAKSVLEVDAILPVIRENIISEDEMRHQIEQMSEIGQPLVLPEVQTFTMREYFGGLLTEFTKFPSAPWLFILGCMYFFSLSSYLVITDDNNEQVAQLPWRSIWPYALLVLWFPLFPIGVIVSLIRGDGLVPAPAHAGYDWDLSDEVVYVAHDTTTTLEEIERKRKEYNLYAQHDVEGAKEVILSLPNEVGLGMLERSMQKTELAIASHEERAEELALAIKAVRENMRSAKQKLLELREQYENFSSEEGFQEQLVRQFEAIVEMPQVLSVRPLDSKDGIEVVVFVAHEGTDTRYDGGDWKLTMTLEGGFSVLRIRRPNGVRINRSSYGLEGFCFGLRREDIENHVRNGQWGSAVSVATESLAHINPGYNYASTLHSAFCMLVEKGK